MKIFVHDHSPLASDCNNKCGWYELGIQLTFYDASAKKTDYNIRTDLSKLSQNEAR